MRLFANFIVDQNQRSQASGSLKIFSAVTNEAAFKQHQSLRGLLYFADIISFILTLFC